MKIAVPTRDGRVDDHFGHCAYYTIFDVIDGKVTNVSKMASPEGCGCKSGIAPISDREAAKAIIKQENLVKIRSCRNYKVAQLRNSIPYLTEDAAWLLTKISENFRDSLEAKGIERHKLIVTSVLRTDEDVQRLMEYNTVAVKNSAHRHATTFDISYRDFETALFTFKTNEVELKKTLGEVLRDLRKDGLCYVRYEIKPGCFHITVRDLSNYK